jgi:hypothetical protein
MPCYTDDRKWSDQFIPAIKAAIKPILGDSEVAPDEEDKHHNTDLIVLTSERGRIACRVRRLEYLNYSDQFTIRASRPSGARTELQKVVLDGWGDFLFYGFGENGRLEKWTLADLQIFREYMRSQIRVLKLNPDGVAFRVFDWKKFPPEFQVANSI